MESLQRAQAALPQIQKLNPRVELRITSMPTPLRDQDTAFLATYTLIIATDLSFPRLSEINVACRVANRPFYAASTMGMYGYIFADLISHNFVISREKSNVPTRIGPETSTRSIIATSYSTESNGKVTELVTKRETYTPILLARSSPLPPSQISNRRRKFGVSPLLSCLRALWEYQSLVPDSLFPSHTQADIALFTTLATEKHQELQLPAETLRSDILRSFLQNLDGGVELSPVCAFLGGQLAQDAINVVGGKEQPIQNLLLFDGDESKGPVYALHTEMALAPAGSAAPQPQIITQVPAGAVGDKAPLSPASVSQVVSIL